VRGLRAVALTGTLVLATGAAFAADPIKLGVLEDQSGDFAAATIGKVHAIQLATDRDAFKALKSRLTRDCALFETDLFRRNLEAAYVRMWDRWLSGGNPQAFALQPL